MGDLELVGATLLTKPGNKGTHAIWPMIVMCFFSVMALFRIFLYAFSVSVNYPVLAAVGQPFVCGLHLYLNTGL